jgi:hypothetical protein
MGREKESVLRGSSHFLLVAALASLAVASPVWAVEPVAAAPASQLANGTWTVQGRAIGGTRRCGDWLVRVTSRQGQLSGVLSLARSSLPIRNLALQPDGGFTGKTQAGVVGSTHVRAYRVSGTFSGDTVSLTLEDNLCPPRHGTATRQVGSSRSGAMTLLVGLG